MVFKLFCLTLCWNFVLSFWYLSGWWLWIVVITLLAWCLVCYRLLVCCILVLILFGIYLKCMVCLGSVGILCLVDVLFGWVSCLLMCLFLLTFDLWVCDPFAWFAVVVCFCMDFTLLFLFVWFDLGFAF